MNKQIYVSWCKRLSESPEALRMLRDSALVIGVETSNYGDEEKKFQQKGLKVSLHNPMRFWKLDLTDNDFIELIKSKEHNDIIDYIGEENAPVVGFHTCHKVYKLHKKMVSKEPVENGISSIHYDEEVLANNIINNLLRAEELINKDLPEDNEKKILFETAIFHDPGFIGKRDFASENEKIVTKVMDYLTTPRFIRKVLEHPEIKKNGNIGLLFDVAHNYVSANSKVFCGMFKGSVEDYVKEIINASKGKVYQIHINAPASDEEKGLVDAHNPLIPGEPVSEKVLFFAREVLKNNPELTTITLEMEAGDDPVSHAKVLVEQAELVAKELGLEK